MDSFHPNRAQFQLKKRRVISHDTEGRCKVFFKKKKDIRNLVNFHPTTQKSENLYFDALFVQSVMFQPENFRGIMSHETERLCKI